MHTSLFCLSTEKAKTILLGWIIKSYRDIYKNKK